MAAPGSPRRAIFVDARGNGLRATWHAERDQIVLSLWRDDVCTGTFRLAASDAAELAAFLDSSMAGRDEATTVLPRAEAAATTRLVRPA
jgi:hypothetical protein